MDNHDNVKL